MTMIGRPRSLIIGISIQFPFEKSVGNELDDDPSESTDFGFHTCFTTQPLTMIGRPRSSSIGISIQFPFEKSVGILLDDDSSGTTDFGFQTCFTSCFNLESVCKTGFEITLGFADCLAFGFFLVLETLSTFYF